MAGRIVHIEGFKACREALQELSKTVQRNVGKRSLLVPAGIVAAAMKANAPVSDDPNDPTPGSLKESITVKPDKVRKGKVSVVVIAEDPAAVPTEFGTYKDPAQGWARAAVDAVRIPAGTAFAGALRGEVDAAVARAAKKGGK